MMDFSAAGIRELMLDLVAIPSVSGSEGENAVARRIHTLLAAEPYFLAHPERVRFIPTEQQGLRREAVMAFVPADSPTPRTLLLTGHHDVVDTDVCGDCASLAYDPVAYTARMKDRTMPGDAQTDLASGNYLFGRGTMDMKAGLALHMAYLAHRARHSLAFADDPSTALPLGINLLFLSVPDEEANSVGMRGALPALVDFLEQHQLECVAAFTGEPAFWSSGPAPYRIYYTGTTGKMMPFFYCVGREAHVGYYYDGVNAATLAAHVTCAMDGNPAFIEGSGGETLCPPTCLKLEDRRNVYSVTLAERAVAYFNLLTMSQTPAAVLEACRDVAAQALQATLDRIRASGDMYGKATGLGSPVPDWSSRVLSYAELHQQTVLSLGADVVAMELDKVLRALPEQTDQRVQSLAVLDRLVSLSNLKGPAIVVGFVPPYYPPRLNTRATQPERHLLRIMEQVVQLAQDKCGQVRLVECFGGITDLSFLGFSGTPEELDALSTNMPGWGQVYDIPVEALLRLNVPVANMGPSGKDAHKDTERLECAYSFAIAPGLLETAVQELERGTA